MAETRDGRVEEFEARLRAMAPLSGGLIHLGPTETVYLRQSPDQIAQRINHSLHGLMTTEPMTRSGSDTSAHEPAP